MERHPVHVRRAIIWVSWEHLTDMFRTLAGQGAGWMVLGLELPEDAACIGVVDNAVRQETGFIFTSPAFWPHSARAEAREIKYRWSPTGDTHREELQHEHTRAGGQRTA